MIVSQKPFKVDEHTFLSLPENVGKDKAIYEDDVATDDEKRFNLVVHCTDDLRKEFSGKLIFNKAIAFISWVVCAFDIYLTATRMAYGEASLRNYIGLSAAFIIVAILTKQAFNPIVRDFNAKWVNLKTGRTNLAGGFTLPKERV